MLLHRFSVQRCVSVAALAGFLLFGTGAGSTAEGDGTYAGFIESPRGSTAIQLELNGEAAQLRFPGRDPVALTVERSTTGVTLRRLSSVGPSEFVLTAGHDHGAATLAGSFSQPGRTYPVHAVPLHMPSAAVQSARNGVYRAADGHLIVIGEDEEAGGLPTFYDDATRRVGVLYPVTPNLDLLGPGLELVLPAAATFEFPSDRAVTIRYGDAPPITAERIDPYRSEDVTFRNGGVTLRGTLMIPDTPGPHPAVVLIHGSGASQRPFGIQPYALMHVGIAVLGFDKRGAGGSTGDYRTATFDDLAGDVIAAVELVKRHAGIDPKRIGIFASSNGGWVAPLVATRSADVAFVICRVCSMVTVEANVAYEREGEARNYGLSEADVERTVALRNAYSRAIITNSGWDELRAAVRASADPPLARLAGLPDADRLVPPPERLRATRAQLLFDPTPSWRRVSVPVLFLYGANDRSVRTAESAPRAETNLREAGNRDATVVTLPGADHAFLESRSGLPSEASTATHYAPGFFSTVEEWLQRHGFTVVRAPLSNR